MLAGIVAGRLLAGAINGQILARLILVFVLLLLFLLGAQIGANRSLLSSLAALGWQAFLLTAAAVAGSVGAIRIFMRCLKKRNLHLIADRQDD